MNGGGGEGKACELGSGCLYEGQDLSPGTLAPSWGGPGWGSGIQSSLGQSRCIRVKALWARPGAPVGAQGLGAGREGGCGD